MNRFEPRRVAESEITLAQVMLPSDANPSGNVHGGTLMKLADTAGGTVASRHARRRVVTVAMDSMTFLQPVYVGDLVLLRARVTWVGTTSLETEVSIEAEDVVSGERRHTSTAFFVYVALDEHGRKHPMPELIVTTDEERGRWSAAEERQAYRLARREAVEPDGAATLPARGSGPLGSCSVTLVPEVEHGRLKGDVASLG